MKDPLVEKVLLFPIDILLELRHGCKNLFFIELEIMVEDVALRHSVDMVGTVGGDPVSLAFHYLLICLLTGGACGGLVRPEHAAR